MIDPIEIDNNQRKFGIATGALWRETSALHAPSGGPQLIDSYSILLYASWWWGLAILGHRLGFNSA